MNRLTELIVGMLQEHKGGKRFYENLDAEIGRNFDIFNCLYSAVPENVGIIVSGRFGEVFSDYVLTTRKTKNRLLVVTGGIRTGNDIEDLAGYIAEGEGYFFLDDSLWSGGTRTGIKEALSKNGAKLIGTYIVYDGSKQRHPEVNSMYRYYDHHPLTKSA